MKGKVLLSVVFVALMAFMPALSWAGTSITFSSDETFFDNFDQSDDAGGKYEKFIDDFFTTNEKVFPTGLVMTNTLGYPNGKAMIGQFPHFQVGAAAGGGAYMLDRYETFTEDNPTSPFGGLNAGFHVGTGITDRFDITFKLFNLGWFSVPELEYSKDYEDTYYELTVKDYNVISAGVKARYNVLPGTSTGPSLFAFSGINLNLAIDYMKGETNAELLIQDVEELEVGLANEVITAGTEYTCEGQIEWSFVSVTPEVLVYLDFLWFMTLYTGPSVSVNSGSMDVNLTGYGDVVVEDEEGFSPTDKGDKIAELTVESDYSMKPKRLLPKWTLGLEINIWVLKIHAEAVSILNSPTDSFMAQVGTRLQF